MNDFSNEAYYLFFSALANRANLAIIDSLKKTKSKENHNFSAHRPARTLRIPSFRQIRERKTVFFKSRNHKAGF